MSKKVWVYGSRTGLWYQVDEKDRDFKYGISEARMAEIGFEQAQTEYMRPVRI